MDFAGGQNSYFVRNWQVLYGFYTSHRHEHNDSVHLFIKGIHFPVISRIHMEPWFKQKQEAKQWAMKFSQGGKILTFQNIVKFILVFDGFP